MNHSKMKLALLCVIAWSVLAAPIFANAAGPSITSLSPTSGPVGGFVTILGSSFGTSQGTSTLTFNGTPATTVSFWTSYEIQAYVPSGATSGNVVVTVSRKASNGVAFTVTPPPAITSISPTSGPVGSSVTISGSNFAQTGSYGVYFGGTNAQITSWSTSQIVAVVPIATSGNVSVLSDGVSSNGVPFTVWPYISSVSPGFGPPGTSVTISGLNFGSTQGNSTVTFNGVSAAVTSWSSASIVATVPSGAAPGNIVVTVNGEASNGYNFAVGSLSSPSYHLHEEAGWLSGTDLLSTTGPDASSTSIQSQDLNGMTNGSEYPIKEFSTQSVVPGFIPASTTVTLSLWMSESAAVSGLYPYIDVDYLNASGYQGTLCLGTGTTALTTTLTKLQVSCTINGPVTLGINNRLYVSVYVTNKGSTIANSVVASLYLEGSLNGNYDSQAVIPEVLYPAISALSPSSGNSGTSVTITGSAFGTSQGSSTVTFNGISASPSSWSDTSIAVPVPANATTGPVVVTVSGQATNAVTFTVTPAISSISPSSGPVGTAATIGGSGFGATQGSSSVSFNGIPALATSWSSSSITAQVPPGATTGPISVTVSGVVGSGGSFTVTPLVTAIAPSVGAWGSSVRIRGYNFGTTQGTVTFNGVAANLGSWLDNSIVATVPHDATSGPVAVVTAGGYSANSVNFTVAPSIASISPTAGSAGTSVTISGLNFGATQGSSQVFFNGIAASPISWSNTSITVPAPSSVSTGPVTVVSGGASSNGVAFLVAPSIAALSPSSGIAGTVVTITGTSFGISQSSSTVQFGGTISSPTSWSNASIVVPVPSGAASGQVVVTVDGTPSNGMAFTVGSGGLSGVVSANGSAIAGATVQALQSGKVVATTTTAADGSYAMNSLAPGTYDVLASASGYGAALSSNQSVAANGTTTVNFSLSTPGSISGQVTQSSGTALPGATVTVSMGGDVLGTATTDSGGNYSIGSLGSGAYSVTAAESGYSSQTQNVSVSGGTATPAHFSLTAQSVITYTYDAHGRLVGASDSLSNTAVYQYDAVGNLLSISRNSSSQTSIIELSPTSGPVGSTVTISGTGFSTNASQDSVSFNGTAATITSASATQLVVTVPSGASTGTVAVTAPSGTATSSQTFTVTSGGSGQPTITGFTPGSGVASTAVTINGTGFDSNQSNDVVTFNISPATLTSATSTAIATLVPPAVSSGHISVRTRNGTAVSGQDFYVPFGAYTASQIGFTGRMAENSTQTVTIATTGSMGLELFDGVAGQAITISASSSTFSSCNLLLIDPFGRQVTNMGCTGSSHSTGVQTLSYSGTYTIGIDPQGTTGNVSVSVNQNEVANVTGTLSSGVPSTVTMSYPQSAIYSFGGTAGQVASLQMSNGTWSGYVTLSIVSPDGQTLASANTNSSLELGPIVLPKTGTYTVVFSPESGHATITLWLSDNVVGPTLNSGTPATVTLSSPGQSESLTFSGNAGQSASVQLSNATFGCCVNVSILSPDGSTLASNYTAGTSLTIGPIILPGTGNYTVMVSPRAGYLPTGSASITAWIFNNAAGPTITSGTPATATLTTPGQSESLTFSGTAGQVASVQMSNAAFSDYVTLSLVSPDGHALVSNSTNGSSLLLGPIVLPGTGTYTLVIAPYSGRLPTGSATITVWLSNNITGPAITSGSPTTVTLSSPGQSESFTFSGTAGQVATVQMSNAAFTDYVTVSIVSPDGQTVVSNSAESGSLLVGPAVLPGTGTYTLIVAPYSGRAPTGSATLTLSLSNNIVGPAITSGTPATVTLSSPGQSESLTFSGSAGQLASVQMSNAAFSDYVTVSIVGPDGQALVSGSTDGSSLLLGPIALPVAGTYTVVIAPYSGRAPTGSASITLTLSAIGAIAPGTPTTVTVSSSGQVAELSFSAIMGQAATVQVTNFNFTVACSSVTVSILNPNGSTLASGNACGSVFANPVILPSAGTYILKVAPQNGGTGSATVTLSLSTELSGSITSDGTPVTVTLSSPGQGESLTFTGSTGQSASVQMSSATFGCCVDISILNPDGTTLTSKYTSGSSLIIGPVILPANGTYTVVVSPYAGYQPTGSAKISLWSFNNIVGPTITSGNSATITLSSPGQSESVTFSGTAGQSLSLQLSSSTFGSYVVVSILNPDGTTLASNLTGGSSLLIGPVILQATGTYTVVFSSYPATLISGSASVTVWLFNNVVGSTITSGTPATITLSSPGQSESMTFSGTAGQSVSLQMADSTLSDTVIVSILNPDGTTLTSNNTPAGWSLLLGPVILPATGTYTVLLASYPQHLASGSAQVTVWVFNNIVGPTITSGTPVTITLSSAGQSESVAFSGTAGQFATLQMSNSTFSDAVEINILNPDGTTLIVNYVGPGGSLLLGPETLPVTGTYTVVISSQAGHLAGGSATITLTLQ